jgi:tetratricopeptide (TPR) repeat protein
MTTPHARTLRRIAAGAPVLALLALLAQLVLLAAPAAAEPRSALERLAGAAGHGQPVLAHAALGLVACGVALVTLVARRRRHDAERRHFATQQKLRAPKVFQAALVARPLRRPEPSTPTRRPATYTAPAAAAADRLAAPGPVSVEVAARAAALRAASVRESAQRAALLRAAQARTAGANAPPALASAPAPVAPSAARPPAQAAAPERVVASDGSDRSERVVAPVRVVTAERVESLRVASQRSEARRRAAALRTIERRERDTAQALFGAAADAAIPLPAPAAAAPRPAELAPRPAELAPEREEPALAADALQGSAERPSGLPAPAPQPKPPAPPHAPRAEAAPSSGHRVAILHASGPLTFEWLESCLARDPGDFQARLDLCTALLVAERYADAERVAREGLEHEPADGRLLLRLSEALCGQERVDEALEAGIRAVRTHRSRKAVLHLTRLSALARRFTPADGPRLRKALEGRPQDPVLLHALGVFESMHGSPRHALALLRLALRHEKNARLRRLVSREVARLRAEEIAGGSLSGAPPRRAAS